MCPSGDARAIRLIKTAALHQTLFRGLNQHDRSFFTPQVESPVGVEQGALWTFSVSPERLACIEIDAGHHAAAVAAIGAVKSAIDNNHAAVVILHLHCGVSFLRLKLAVW